eukprot:TRINITY_DN620_c0_g1_i2.p1 TRINITY_DN620_c0_g1~~TRINITY_DN620_c0_g1_i2.p1  ORF type:complete len:1538 (+),score=397.72 TRINITY_DN620_c0_g1_i2:117-4730(+)
MAAFGLPSFIFLLTSTFAARCLCLRLDDEEGATPKRNTERGHFQDIVEAQADEEASSTDYAFDGSAEALVQRDYSDGYSAKAPLTTGRIFHCNGAQAHWRIEWSEEKKEYCCRLNHQFCDGTVSRQASAGNKLLLDVGQAMGVAGNGTKKNENDNGDIVYDRDPPGAGLNQEAGRNLNNQGGDDSGLGPTSIVRSLARVLNEAEKVLMLGTAANKHKRQSPRQLAGASGSGCLGSSDSASQSTNDEGELILQPTPGCSPSVGASDDRATLSRMLEEEESAVLSEQPDPTLALRVLPDSITSADVQPRTQSTHARLMTLPNSDKSVDKEIEYITKAVNAASGKAKEVVPRVSWVHDPSDDTVEITMVAKINRSELLKVKPPPLKYIPGVQPPKDPPEVPTTNTTAEVPTPNSTPEVTSPPLSYIPGNPPPPEVSPPSTTGEDFGHPPPFVSPQRPQSPIAGTPEAGEGTLSPPLSTRQFIPQAGEGTLSPPLSTRPFIPQAGEGTLSPPLSTRQFIPQATLPPPPSTRPFTLQGTLPPPLSTRPFTPQAGEGTLSPPLSTRQFIPQVNTSLPSTPRPLTTDVFIPPVITTTTPSMAQRLKELEGLTMYQTVRGSAGSYENGSIKDDGTIGQVELNMKKKWARTRGRNKAKSRHHRRSMRKGKKDSQTKEFSNVNLIPSHVASAWEKNSKTTTTTDGDTDVADFMKEEDKPEKIGTSKLLTEKMAREKKTKKEKVPAGCPDIDGIVGEAVRKVSDEGGCDNPILGRFNCPEGFSLRVNYRSIKDRTQKDCCESTIAAMSCTNFACPPGWTRKPGSNNTFGMDRFACCIDLRAAMQALSSQKDDSETVRIVSKVEASQDASDKKEEREQGKEDASSVKKEEKEQGKEDASSAKKEEKEQGKEDASSVKKEEKEQGKEDASSAKKEEKEQGKEDASSAKKEEKEQGKEDASSAKKEEKEQGKENASSVKKDASSVKKKKTVADATEEKKKAADATEEKKKAADATEEEGTAQRKEEANSVKKKKKEQGKDAADAVKKTNTEEKEDKASKEEKKKKKKLEKQANLNLRREMESLTFEKKRAKEKQKVTEKKKAAEATEEAKKKTQKSPKRLVGQENGEAEISSGWDKLLSGVRHQMSEDAAAATKKAKHKVGHTSEEPSPRDKEKQKTTKQSSDSEKDEPGEEEEERKTKTKLLLGQGQESDEEERKTKTKLLLGQGQESDEEERKTKTKLLLGQGQESDEETVVPQLHNVAIGQGREEEIDEEDEIKEEDDEEEPMEKPESPQGSFEEHVTASRRKRPTVAEMRHGSTKNDAEESQVSHRLGQTESQTRSSGITEGATVRSTQKKPSKASPESNKRKSSSETTSTDVTTQTTTESPEELIPQADLFPPISREGGRKSGTNIESALEEGVAEDNEDGENKHGMDTAIHATVPALEPDHAVVMFTEEGVKVASQFEQGIHQSRSDKPAMKSPQLVAFAEENSVSVVNPSKSRHKACLDRNPACVAWSFEGECENNPLFMDVECTLSCGKCGDARNGSSKIAPR